MKLNEQSNQWASQYEPGIVASIAASIVFGSRTVRYGKLPNELDDFPVIPLGPWLCYQRVGHLEKNMGRLQHLDFGDPSSLLLGIPWLFHPLSVLDAYPWKSHMATGDPPSMEPAMLHLSRWRTKPFFVSSGVPMWEHVGWWMMEDALKLD